MAIPATTDELLLDPAIARDKRRRNAILAGRIIVCVTLLVGWQLLGPHIDRLIFSAPSEVAGRLWEWSLDGTLWRNLLVTAEEILLGYALGVFFGVVLGLALGSYPVVAAILDPILMAIYGVPKIAFGPLFIVWFGINMTPKVVITALMVFFFVFFTTYEGARAVDRDLIRVVKLMGASRWQERTLVVIPGSLPAILLGLKLAIPEALIGAIVGELIVSSRGIGYLVQFSASQLDSAGIFAALFVLMVLTLLANSAVNYATGKSGRRNPP
ncbi:MAG TPA: ABC transporter permease [Stellaceae bacterium]|nr:ABC transporter permease [Stellaceae bacterium]